MTMLHSLDISNDPFSLIYRSLRHVADMVGARLATIPQSVRVRYWHNAVLNLYGYLYFERL